MKCKIIFLLTALFSFFIGNAQNITNKGLEFWVGYGHHQYMERSCDGTTEGPNDMNMVLYLSAEEETDVTVTLDSSALLVGSWYRKTYHIPANTVISTENLPKGTVNATPSASNPNYDARLYTDAPPSGSGGEGLFRKKGIHIVSTKPIVAYAHIYGGVSSGATMLMPVTAWGDSYTSLNSEQRDADRSYSWMYVIAKENNTMVRITPAVVSRLGKPANRSFDVALQKGQIYQLIGQADCATGNGPELTGTTVRSIAGPDGECHMIAVFSGSSRTGGETLTCGTGSGRDNDMQQLFPEQTWGKRYLTAPFSKASGTTTNPSQFQTSVFKVLIKDPGTIVKRNGVQLTGLINNKYYKYSSNTTDSIIADKPVMVGQFMSGTGACNGGEGDPEMVYLSPMEQAIKRIGFYRNTRQSITANFLTLIVPTGGVTNNSLKIDGSTTYYSYPHATPGYTVVVKGWPAAQAQCIVTCDSAFTAITYGLGGAESYAYNAGTYLNNLNGLSNLNNISDTTNHGNNSHLFTCTGSPVKLSILVRYQPTKLVWKLSRLGSAISPNADVTLDPASDAYKGIVMANGVPYYKYTLPDTYTFTADGKFDVTVLSTSPSLTENCNNTEELTISFEVKPSPTADFTFSNPTGCVKDTTFFFGPAATGISDAQQWLWTFPDGSVSHHQDTSKVFSTAGNNTVVLKAVSKEGCIASVSKTVNVVPVPSAGVTFNPASVCEGNSVTFTPTAAYTGLLPVATYYWNFGDGAPKTVATADPQTILYNTPGTHEVKFVAGVSKLCVSDTISKTVVIYSKPQVDIAYPAGCLPANGIVQFTNNTNMPDGQTFTSHAWNFGDANATAGNPNTSTAVSPSHQYTAFGNYDIAYKVTSSQGCIKDTVIKATFNLAPNLTYPALASVCEKALPFSIATASVTNGVQGSYVYSGPGTDNNGLFSPAVAGPGTHTITYTFTSTANCVVSTTQQITVKASPLASFIIPAGCLPANGLVSFDNNSTISSNEALTWLWTFGDTQASTGNENTSAAFEPSHTFTDGTYTINLKATATASGCAKDTTIVAIFNVTPVVNYPALAPVCESAAAYSIAKATVNGAVITGGTYSGKGVAANGQFDPGTAGAGTYMITYTYTTTGGCSAQATSSIQVYARPAAAFSVNKDACLGDKTTITPATAADIQTWNWKLGNGNTKTATNSNAFDVTYAAATNYTIELVTENQLGCASLVKTETVSIHPLPVADFDVPVKICLPGAALFNNTSTVSDNADLAYLWNFGDGTAATVTDENPSYTYARAGTYPVTLRATSSFGCKYTSGAKYVNDFYDRPVASFTVSPAEVCQGTEASFIDASTPANAIANWRWDFADGTLSSDRFPKKKYETPGSYDVKLTVTNKVGCAATVPKRVTVHLQPEIDAGKSFVVAEGTRVQFEATANSTALSLHWTPAADLSDPTMLKPTLVVTKDETYTLTAVGEYNCTATDFLTVKMYKTVVIPNAFTPNGDNTNDRWLIPSLADYAACTVQVFNRYGQKVLDVKGYSTPWDGKMNGKELPMGTYYYVIKLGDGTAPITGSVTIIR
jgi:gliding motility-associated-like protein